ncbi:MAG: GNAT family N-acetyltransferase [Alteraurantiacibacter sp.]
MIPSDWSIRLAHPVNAEDLAEVEEDAARILRDAPSLAEIPTLPTRSAADYRAVIAQRQSLVAVSQDRIIGFAAARPAGRALHLHSLNVARAFQRNGIGGTLLRALQIDARNAGFASITLHVFRDISWHKPFFAGYGFSDQQDQGAHPRQAKGRHPTAIAGIPADRLCAMVCPLD